MATMETPWQADLSRSEEEDHRLLGQILERSTSAPPMKSEDTSLSFEADLGGDDDDAFLFGRAARNRGRAQASRLGSLYDTSGRDTAPLSSGTDSGFLRGYEEKAGRSTAPGVPSLEDSWFLNDFAPSSGARRDQFHFSLDGGGPPETTLMRSQSEAQQRNFGLPMPPETSLMRSQSAAPKLFAIPPGLGLGQQEQTQELKESSLLSDQAVDIMQRRPASTSRLGDHATAVRPAPRNVFDLIHDDDNDIPRSLTPPYQPAPVDALYSGEYEKRARGFQRQDDGLGRLTQSMERMDAHFVRETPISSRSQYASPPRQRVITTRSSEPDRPMYASSGHVPSQSMHQPRHHVPIRQAAPQYYEAPQQQLYEAPQQPQVYYLDQQQQQQQQQQPSTGVTAQILPSGQTVYVSSAAYGYPNVQYHPTAAPQIHQAQARSHLQQPLQQSRHDYVRVVPVQGEGGQIYWHQSEASPNHGMNPTVAVVGGTQMGLTRVVAVPLETSPTSATRQHGRHHHHQHQHKGTPLRSPDKGGRGRRGGGAGGGRRAGGLDTFSKHPMGAPPSSPLMEEFRASKSRDWTMLNIQGHVVEFCQDQNGSRFIQQRLEIGNDIEQQIVMKEILPAVDRLRNDVFGNYVVQKLLEFGTPEMKAQLRETLKGEMLVLSLQMYGCRVVQKALETLADDDLPGLLVEFHHNVIACIHDQNGNHVIQKCIEVMSIKAKGALERGDEQRSQFFNGQIAFVIEDVLSNVESLSCHPYGCRVLQRILEHCVEETTERTLDEIRLCHRTLLDDQYGNYVIQHVLQYGRHSDRESILHLVIENGLLNLSKQKFASNVVEKLLKYGTPEQRNSVVREMLKTVYSSDTQADGSPTKCSVVLLMVRDAYANYVVQTTLDVAPEGEDRRLLLEELNSHSTELRNFTFAKHIVTKLGS